MPQHAHHYARILAIDPSTKGFGFAVLEGRGRLIDWGVAELYSRNDKEFLTRVEAIIDRYSPVVVAVEDVLVNQRRGERAKRRINAVVGYVHLREIHPAIVSFAEVRTLLGLPEDSTKHETAKVLITSFPELESVLPPKRRPWQSEDARMNIFDAVGLAVVGRGDLWRWRRFAGDTGTGTGH